MLCSFLDLVSISSCSGLNDGGPFSQLATCNNLFWEECMSSKLLVWDEGLLIACMGLTVLLKFVC